MCPINIRITVNMVRSIVQNMKEDFGYFRMHVRVAYTYIAARVSNCATILLHNLDLNFLLRIRKTVDSVSWNRLRRTVSDSTSISHEAN
jgi:hypothetical protein